MLFGSVSTDSQKNPLDENHIKHRNWQYLRMSVECKCDGIFGETSGHGRFDRKPIKTPKKIKPGITHTVVYCTVGT